MCTQFLYEIPANTSTRIMLASIRNLGACPCPRCLIPLSRAHNLGMVRDRTQRVTMVRVDDGSRQGKVKTARRLIYEKHYQINGTAIENLLKDQSLVPTAVCHLYFVFLPTHHLTECFLGEAISAWFQFLLDLPSRFNARLRIGRLAVALHPSIADTSGC
jgi:hypothetical protein